MNEHDAWPDPAVLVEWEQTAVAMARLAGAEIVNALGRTLTVRYKTFVGEDAPPRYRDPVSEVDHNVESLIRKRVADQFPSHDILGEEMDEPSREAATVWAIDPVDGTSNFINGFPLFAASIAVLHQGVPVVGAIWCSATHALRAGIYHAHAGSPLKFEGEAMAMRENPSIRRRLAGTPYLAGIHEAGWDFRKTGSAAIECAFVAAGLLEVANFARPNVWDVAAGVCLVQASGLAASVRDGDAWNDFRGFGSPPPRVWGRPLILGSAKAIQTLRQGL
ncbi:inositol monophosphatase [Roseomonas terrae]|jgi:myo-inositol-1(or 4)-monophosphatase|uniref:Inositol monophosphatase n=1 Tax=Neoroseomonas terrae TaxID=424799 RepID=A0ABS5EDR6_9PROT|nr:inositol monophosphatase [Neoroseomonas terrae]MBR0648852.1 inositol monophosphatase [Neoroseomonas terrae]